MRLPKLDPKWIAIAALVGLVAGALGGLWATISVAYASEDFTGPPVDPNVTTGALDPNVSTGDLDPNVSAPGLPRIDAEAPIPPPAAYGMRPGWQGSVRRCDPRVFPSCCPDPDEAERAPAVTAPAPLAVGEEPEAAGEPGDDEETTPPDTSGEALLPGGGVLRVR